MACRPRSPRTQNQAHHASHSKMMSGEKNQNASAVNKMKAFFFSYAGEMFNVVLNGIKSQIPSLMILFILSPAQIIGPFKVQSKKLEIAFQGAENISQNLPRLDISCSQLKLQHTLQIKTRFNFMNPKSSLYINQWCKGNDLT